MKDTKTNILLTSRGLFNQLGYANVTIRMIALKLKISSGNLNYHFKKKEDILEALYFEMVQEFDDRIKQLEQRDFTFKNIQEDIATSLERMVDYRFFWTDLYNLIRLNSKIKSHFAHAYERRRQGYEYLFQVLQDKETMCRLESSMEKKHLIERMISISNTWLYNSFLYDKKITVAYIQLQTQALLLMLYPYLTDQGKSEFKKVVQIA